MFLIKVNIFYFIANFNICIFFYYIILSSWYRTRFFEESVVCGLKNSSEIISKEELLKQLQVKNVSCKDVTFRILGFSLTTINMIISLFITFILSKIFINYEKFKK